ncbi:AfsR/SARP family transcriptional regulator [Micromonospora okii]|uniref:AfsR/SARP family transcriptional regulator n=1 Tax=Micromonospora okii TaxID=1182970 RepID=UPI001E55A5E5|nr:BTAD domain-containing putative transcriptional regulator [Micromonospora okii]
MAQLRITVLGPLEVERNGEVVRLGPRQAELLSVLVLALGRPVLANRLVALLWGAGAGDGAAATLRSHVSHLRRALACGRSGPAAAPVVATVGAGAGLAYRLDLAPDQLDAHLFEREITQGRGLLDGGDPAALSRAAELFGTALARWRGAPFANVADRPFALSEVARLEALCRTARRGHAEALIALGRHGAAIGDLTGAVAQFPYDEGLRHLLALALYAEQRVDEAAEVCRHGAALLRERGMDAPRLQRLHGAILRREELPVGPPAPAGAGSTPMAPPSLLPADPPHFVGRAAALDDARRHCLAPGPRRVLLVTGAAGVGKTSFAVRLAHLLAPDLPDGCLYVNLRGFDPGGPALSSDEAVRLFLDALQVPPERIPASREGRAGRYRALLSQRRMLVVLDNARDAEQVRPLLPGAPGCAVVVTSRSQMPGLVAIEGARPVTLGLLTAAEARELLVARLADGRVTAEPGPTDGIIERCARLPLALAIVAARAAANPGFPLAALARELAESQGSLDGFAAGDPATDLRAVFSWSYRALDEPAARVFRLLGLHPGQDISAPAAASLAAMPERQARPVLAELARAQLVIERAPGRYTCHDLLRAYAAELVGSEPDAVRRAARHRIVDHYLRSARAADERFSPLRKPTTPPPAQPGVTPEEPADNGRALAWFAEEHDVLGRVVEMAAGHGFDRHVWQLASALTTFLSRRGYWEDLIVAQNHALAAAERTDDRAATARAHGDIAAAYAETSRLGSARAHLESALALLDEQGDRAGQAQTLLTLSWVSEKEGDQATALRHDQLALRLFRAAGHPAGEARALNAVGWDHAVLGEHRETVRYCQWALILQRRLGDAVGEANSWDTLGYAHHHLGNHRRAARCFRRALALNQELGHRYNEAETLEHLGDNYEALGDPVAGRHCWLQALEILTEMGHPMAERLRDKLAAGHREPAVESAAMAGRAG